MRTLITKIDDTFGLFAILSYSLVGSLSAILSFASFALCWDVFHIYYPIAVTLSYIFTIFFNFYCNRHFTFKRSGVHLTRHMYRYITPILLNYVITMAIVHITVEWLTLSPCLGLVASMAVTAVIGFTLSKFWVYTTN